MKRTKPVLFTSVRIPAEYFSDLERYFRDNITAVAAQAEKQRRPMRAPYAFELKRFGRSMFAVEKMAKVALFAFRLPDLT